MDTNTSDGVKTLSEQNIFTIDCKDVYLREYIIDDLDQFHALTWQPEIHKYLPGWNVSKEQRKDWLINYEIPGNKQFLNTVFEGGDIGELRLRLGIILKNRENLSVGAVQELKRNCRHQTEKLCLQSQMIIEAKVIPRKLQKG